MSAIGRKLRRLEGGRIAFWCPGCKSMHQVRVVAEQGTGPLWMWNQCTDSVTLEPSILVNAQGPYFNPGAPICHSFLREGQLQFLGDCTHELAGKTVPLPNFPDDFKVN